MSFRLALLPAALAAGLVPAAAQAHSGAHPTRYVAASGRDAGECMLTAPCASLGYALAKTGKGERVLVAEGEYALEGDEIFFLLAERARIEGGYSTADGYKHRDVEKHATRVHGLPHEYRDKLARFGLQLLQDAKGRHAKLPERQARMLAVQSAISQGAEGPKPCVDGKAGAYDCHRVDLLSHLPLNELMPDASSASNLWGFKDLNDGREYALIGLDSGTAVVDVSTPTAPRVVGTVPGNRSDWREVKVYQRRVGERYQAYAYISTEAAGSGMQILDLSALPERVSLAGTLADFGRSHTVYVSNVDYGTNVAEAGASAYLYVEGTDKAGGALRAYELADPLQPSLVMTPPAGTGYVHDATSMLIADARAEQCAPGHRPCEIVFDYNESTVDIWDATDKARPVKLSSTPYEQTGFTHSGWYDKSRQYLYIQDELDEQRFGLNSNIRVLDIRDLKAPKLVGRWTGTTKAIDHNGYTVGDKYYMSNYRRGLTVLDISEPRVPRESGFFDTFPVPAENTARFNGAWGVYPFLPSGTLLVSDIENGLYMLKDNSVAAPASAGSLGLELAEAGAQETAGSLSLRVTRTGGSAGAVSARYATADGTAVAGRDYTATSGTLSWADGDGAAKTVRVPLLDDTEVEAEERFSLSLSEAGGGAALGQATATIRLSSEDQAPVNAGKLGFTAASAEAAETAGTLSVAVARTGGSGGAVSVKYATADGSAVAGSDYSAVSGTLSWADGETGSKTIAVPLLDDTAVEGVEQFSLKLSEPGGNAGLEQAELSVRLSSNDQAPTTPPASGGGGGGGAWGWGALALGLLARGRRRAV